MLLYSTYLTESCENCRNSVYFSFDEPSSSARTTGQAVLPGATSYNTHCVEPKQFYDLEIPLYVALDLNALDSVLLHADQFLISAANHTRRYVRVREYIRRREHKTYYPNVQEKKA